MWSLKNISTSKRHYFLVGKEYIVGRKDSDILIKDDMSISRKHAILKINHSERNLSNSGKPSEFIIKDISKLGTQLPDKRISNGEEEFLRAGEIISFGTSSNNNYEVVCESLVVTASCVPNQTKKVLKKALFKLGGSLLNEWSQECTYVTMLNLSLTVKVACALLSQKSIVTPSFFEELLKHIESNENGDIHDILPPSSYLPMMEESQLNPADVSFAPLPHRSIIFKNKTFTFLLSEQFIRLKPVIKLASGLPKFLDVSTSSFKMDSGVNEILMEGCVILPESNENSMQHQDKIKLVILCLNRSHRRLIPESEVGFAILYCSTQHYCNPSKKMQKQAISPPTLVPPQPSIIHQSSVLPPTSVPHKPLTSHQPTLPKHYSIFTKSVSSQNSKTTVADASSGSNNNSETSQIHKERTTKSSNTCTKSIEQTAKSPVKPVLKELDAREGKMNETEESFNNEVMRDSCRMDESSCNLFPCDSEVGKESRPKQDVLTDDKRCNNEDSKEQSRVKRKSSPENHDDARPLKVVKTEMMEGGIDEGKSLDTIDLSSSHSSHISFSHPSSTHLYPTHPSSPYPSNLPPSSQLKDCLNTRCIDSRYLDVTFEALGRVEGRCMVVEAHLVVRNVKAVMVEWNGQKVLNYKRFVKNPVKKTSKILGNDDLFIQPTRNLNEVAMKMDDTIQHIG